MSLLLAQDAVMGAPHDGGNFLTRLLEWVGPPEWVPGWALALTGVMVGVGILVGMVSLIAMWSVWMERKVSGHIQCRYGPMYAGGWHGWAQTIADGVKLLLKEDMIPKGADRALFWMAPAIVLAGIFGALAAMPLSYDWYFARMDLGIFTILALGSTTTIGVVMAGWASNSKWSLYGAMREAAQVVAYEIPLGISLLCPLMTLGTFSLIDASAEQATLFGFDCGMGWAVFTNPFNIAAFVIFWIAALAETKRAPFDLPEAESELVAGFLTEYSGIRWSFFFMEEYAAMFLFSVVGAFYFFGGFESPLTYIASGPMGLGDGHFIVYALGAVTIIAKGMAGIFLMMWLRWTLPRLRIDQVMTLGYKYLTPLSLLCVLGAACVEWAKAQF